MVRITFGEDSVWWDDFKGATYLEPAKVGPFKFDRKEYEAALLAA